MDIKDIIKWFIPCFHVLLIGFKKMALWLTFLCLFLLFCPNSAARLSASDVGLSNKYLNAKINSENSFNISSNYDVPEGIKARSIEDTSMGRTFGRPFKKMIQAFIPLAFQMGAASTWAVVAALIGFKTLAITLVILKLLLIAGAAKFGALFASKTHHSGWEQPHHQQKEIHLHIHNGQHGEEHIPISPWSREGQAATDAKPINVVYEPYGGPQTISTPYGHYMKIEPVANRAR